MEEFREIGEEGAVIAEGGRRVWTQERRPQRKSGLLSINSLYGAMYYVMGLLVLKKGGFSCSLLSERDE